ncbi:hypothetical protein EVAR_8076_1 [Eumeta japonica]|uniref:Uncharacterized protein n=1 Tax=Eumeta variegata TaxID=151549 RepID=A0A4C1TSL0_EUMVA|nr:hypothetical protein EVAR_8076_1 [Eumeta japonica]
MFHKDSSKPNMKYTVRTCVFASHSAPQRRHAISRRIGRVVSFVTFFSFRPSDAAGRGRRNITATAVVRGVDTEEGGVQGGSHTSSGRPRVRSEDAFPSRPSRKRVREIEQAEASVRSLALPLS